MYAFCSSSKELVDIKFPASSSDLILNKISCSFLFFGSGVFNSVTFGASENPMVRKTIEGTGTTAYFRLFSDDTNGPYTINGIYIDYTPSGRI